MLQLMVFLSAFQLAAQHFEFEFGQETSMENFYGHEKIPYDTIKWINVNTLDSTWARNEEGLVCFGLPIGVVRSEHHYENFLMHIEWKHMEPGGNSGTFIWSQAIPGENRLPDGVEIQMLELDWVNLNTRDGKKPPDA